MTLRAEKADYLRERIRENCAGTMLAALVERRAALTEVQFPWQLDAPELTETQRALLDHAQRCSEHMHGAALLYNHELAKRRGDDEAEADDRGELENWAAAETATPTVSCLTPSRPRGVMLAQVDRRLLLERAVALLRRGDVSVTEVCFAVGRSSLDTFSTRSPSWSACRRASIGTTRRARRRGCRRAWRNR